MAPAFEIFACTEAVPSPSSPLHTKQALPRQPSLMRGGQCYHHLCQPPLDPLREFPAFLALRSPELDAALQKELSKEPPSAPAASCAAPPDSPRSRSRGAARERARPAHARDGGAERSRTGPGRAEPSRAELSRCCSAASPRMHSPVRTVCQCLVSSQDSAAPWHEVCKKDPGLWP